VEKVEYKNIFDQEDSHFFYVALHELVLNLTKKLARRRSLSILDAGCGTGGLAIRLSKIGKVRAIDLSSVAVHFARKRGVDVIKASVDRIPFKSGLFDLVVSIDVLYHRWVKNDTKPLREFIRVIKPGGILILRVPALAWLSNSHDKWVWGVRRFNKGDLKAKLSSAGFKILVLSYTGAIIAGLIMLDGVLRKFTQRGKGGSGVRKVPKWVNFLFLQILRMENWLISRFGYLPMGAGIIVVARKP